MKGTLRTLREFPGYDVGAGPLNAALGNVIVDIRELVVGATYYRVTYSDPGLTMIGVQPLVYIGTNPCGESNGTELEYYFQDTVSYTWGGEGQVFPHSDAEVQGLLDLPGVHAACAEAVERWTVSGQPKLIPAKR